MASCIDDVDVEMEGGDEEEEMDKSGKSDDYESEWVQIGIVSCIDEFHYFPVSTFFGPKFVWSLPFPW